MGTAGSHHQYPRQKPGNNIYTWSTEGTDYDAKYGSISFSKSKTSYATRESSLQILIWFNQVRELTATSYHEKTINASSFIK